MAAGMLEGVLAHDDDAGAALLAKALALIDRELGNPDLSPALVEAGLPLSRSGLYRLFEPLGGVRAAILQRRLERTMKALLNGKSAKPALRTIVRNHGFQSEEQLTRSFRARFGLTPHQFHAMVRRKDYAGLAAQARARRLRQPASLDRGLSGRRAGGGDANEISGAAILDCHRPRRRAIQYPQSCI